MHKKRAVAAAATTAIALLGAGVGTATAEPTPLTKTGNHRIAGANRYETAVKVSKQSFTTPQDVVFIASGESFADALAAGPLAAAAEAPILLVPKGSLPTVVRNELTRLKPKAIAIVGGTGSISQANMDAIAKYAPAGGTERIFGSNRYATAEQVVSSFDPADIDVVYLASGESFADALGGGAAAAAEAGALLLTAKGGLPAETNRALQYLTPTEVVILGSTGAVSATVASRSSRPPGSPPTVRRRDRFETAAMVAYEPVGHDRREEGLPGLGRQLPRCARGDPGGLHQRRPHHADAQHLHAHGHRPHPRRARPRPERLPRWLHDQLQRRQGLLTRHTRKAPGQLSRGPSHTVGAMGAAAARGSCRIRCRKRLVRSCCGLSMHWLGGPSSTTTPPSMKTTRSATSSGEGHLVRDDDHRHALSWPAPA